MGKAVEITRYKDEKGIVVYAVAQTKDEESAYFFKKLERTTDINRWLTGITTYAKNKTLHQIDQREFLAQFTEFDERGKVTYIHKRDSDVKFTVTS